MIVIIKLIFVILFTITLNSGLGYTSPALTTRLQLASIKLQNPLLTTSKSPNQVNFLLPVISAKQHRFTSSLSSEVNNEASEVNNEASEVNNDESEKRSKNVITRFKNLFKDKSAEGLTTKERIAKMGLSALLSYGFVSNMSYCVCVSIAWFGFNKKTGLSPLAPGQWKGFLAVYAGFFALNNVVRPIRLAISVAVSSKFDYAVAYIQKKTKLSRRAAIGVVVFCTNICGTFALMALGITFASFLSGIPIFPPK